MSDTTKAERLSSFLANTKPRTLARITAACLLASLAVSAARTVAAYCGFGVDFTSALAAAFFYEPFYDAQTALRTLGSLGLVVALFASSGTGVMCALGALCLSYALTVSELAARGYYTVVEIGAGGGLLLLAYGSLLCLLALKRTRREIPDPAWAAPAALVLVSVILSFIDYGFGYDVSYAIGGYVADLLLLTGLALASASAKVGALDKRTAPKLGYSQVGNADQLLGYKKLLDSGGITQEEFDQKKKELLGL